MASRARPVRSRRCSRPGGSARRRPEAGRRAAPRRNRRQRLGEANAEGRDGDRLDRGGPVVPPRVAAANNGFAVAENLVRPAFT